MSAITVMNSMKCLNLDVVPIFVSQSGRWLVKHPMQIGEEELCEVVNLRMSEIGTVVEIGSLIARISCAIPMIHGRYGEDGTIQTILEYFNIPYCGCSSIASRRAYDKDIARQIARNFGIRSVPYILAHYGEDVPAIPFPYPLFVKNASLGSSLGVSLVKNENELGDSLKSAWQYGKKALIEPAIIGNEIECAVLDGVEVTKYDSQCEVAETSLNGCLIRGDKIASPIGEIRITSEYEFYDYNAKYNNKNQTFFTDSNISNAQKIDIQETSLAIFSAINAAGMARVDFFVADDVVYFNEINTIPGFTEISGFPTMWKAAGMDISEIVSCLVRGAVRKSNRIRYRRIVELVI